MIGKRADRERRSAVRLLPARGMVSPAASIMNAPAGRLLRSCGPQSYQRREYLPPRPGSLR